MQEVLASGVDELRVLSERREYNPISGHVSEGNLQIVRFMNERLMSLDPSDYLPALRISRVHLAWAKNERDPDRAADHRALRYAWLGEALLRDPPTHHREVIEKALAGNDVAAPRAATRSTEALRTMTITTLPRELMALAKSLREDEPRLPHLACVAAHRAVAYADGEAAGETDPAVARERYSTRGSLAASLRAARRPREAVDVAQSAVDLRPDHLVGWTVLLGASRDYLGATAAVDVIGDAVSAVGAPNAKADSYFARAAAAAYEKAGQYAQAAVWLEAVLRNKDEPVTRKSRDDVLARARNIVEVLRTRRQLHEAEGLERILEAAQWSATDGV